MADLDRNEERLDDAAAGYRRSAAMWPVLLGEGQPREATTLHNLGSVCLEQGRLDEAEPLLLRALSIWEARLGERSPEAANTRTALTNLRLRRAQPPDAAQDAPAPFHSTGTR